MLTAISPLDGRYTGKVSELSPFFSEYALMHYRVKVETQWLLFLASKTEIHDVRKFSADEVEFVKKIAEKFSVSDAEKIKEIEATTRHDVKAVEYFLKEKLQNSSLSDVSEWVHFACTSEDINNLAYALMLKDAVKQIMLPAADIILEDLEGKAKEWKNLPLLSLTHGQTASPTTLGKVFLVFAARLSAQMAHWDEQHFLGKINGATGSYNAHLAAYPKAPWIDFSQEFVESLGLQWNPFSEQIDPHDFIAELCHTAIRINTILIDFSRDTWGYISRGVFAQKTKEGEVGSSTMPHKVNPIDFENAEGNLGMANALFAFFSEKLPISRFQRDLTDSTVLRNVGVAFGHTLLAFKSLIYGLSKLEVREEKMLEELQNNVEVLAEAIQTVMRKNGCEKPYERLKELTRGKRLSLAEYQNFVENLHDLPEDEKKRLLVLTPEKFVGLSEELVKRFLGK